MHLISSPECARIAQDLQIRKVQVESIVQLLDEGNTIPFIARYRRERTAGLPEEVIRQVSARVNFLRTLHDRKQTILKSIEHHGKLTDELRQAVLGADTMRRLDDLYLPFKPKKRGPGAIARGRGLEAPALAIWHSDPAVGNLDELLAALVNPEKELKTIDELRAGIGHILAEWIAESSELRAPLRAALWELGKISAVKNEKIPNGQGLEYKDYFQFSESARQIPPHRILALNRGEKEGALKIHLDFPKEKIQEIAVDVLAELLLKKAGQPAPQASPPSDAPAPPANEASGTDAAIAAAPAEAATTATAVEQPAQPAPATAASEPPPAGPSPAAVASEPTTPLPEPAPLVATMAPKPVEPPAGELLSPHSTFRTPHLAFLTNVLDDALTRLLLPGLEREIRHELTDEAEAHAVAVFARNLRSLLLQPPLRGKRVLAVDPGFRAGCKVAAIDEHGNLLDHLVIHPFTPLPRKAREKPAPPAQPAAEPDHLPAPSASPPATDTTVAAEAVATPTESASAAVVAEPAAPAPVADASAAPAADSAPAAVEAAPAAPAVDKKAEAKAQIKELVTKHGLHVAALGNGNGCRETEEMIADLIAADLPALSYVIVNEAGTNVYSISQVGREEFPTFDPTLRSAISIGRRLQDPISELVKVDPQNIGVGLYQHDMSRKELRESLDGVVESCVNLVGVEVNTATVPLLRHVSGLNQMVARELVDWRKKHGPFASREQLLQLPSLGPQRWMQAVGFLRFPQAANPLDRMWIHPESYGLTEKILNHLGYSPSVLDDVNGRQELYGKLATLNVDELARTVNANPGVIQDLIEALLKPGYDPRDELPPPIFKKGILRLEDLKPGMELKGTVLNVVDFGAFVDIGLKDSGLVHISQLANRYIKNPYEVVAVNDVVTVWVLTADFERRRVSLTMIAPGTERKPPERRPRREEGARPPRGRRPEGTPRDQQGQPPHDQQRPPHEGRGGRPPRGRHHGRGRPPHGAPVEAGAAAASASTAGDAHHGAAPQSRPPLPPRRPRREPPKPKLTQAAIEGKVPLRTFSELSALFAAKKEKESAPPVPATPAPQAETPPVAAPPDGTAATTPALMEATPPAEPSAGSKESA
jgi:uncharacterized protein